MMKKSMILLCLLCCLCLTACGAQPVSEPNEAPSNSGTLESEIVSAETGLKKTLHVSCSPYILPSGSESGDLEASGVNEDLLIYIDDADDLSILFDIMDGDVVEDYVENIYKYTDMYEAIQTPGLYHMVQHFDVSLENLLETVDTGFYGTQYDKDTLRALYAPYEEMLEATMNPKGAYLDGNVHNIRTLNELFENDSDAFAQIKLDDLIDYQQRLEENGIDYGFNEEMVEFANQYCLVATSLAFSASNYSASIPGSGMVNAAVYDQYGNVMIGETITYALQSAYPGVSIDSTTGAVTVQSGAATGTATIRASYSGYGSVPDATASLIVTYEAAVDGD